MTIFIINGRPHISAHNGFQEISQYEYYMAIEEGEIESVEEVETI